MTHVLLTGAAGFLGVAVAEHLAAAGHRVTRTDARAAGGIDRLDVCDPAALDAAFTGAVPVDAVVHLAAAGDGDRGLVAGADSDPARAVRINVEGFTQVVEAASRHGVPRVLWSSSTTVYGPAGAYPGAVTEDAPLRPQTRYGATKAACEHLGPVLSAGRDLQVCSIRLPMIYGQGRWYGGSQEPLVNLVRAVRAGEAIEIEAWRGDADWVHVDDAAAAFAALLDTTTHLAPTYHAVGHRGSLADLAHAVVAAGGVDEATARIRETPDAAPDLPATDDTLLRDSTGWRPRYQDAAGGAAAYLTPAAPPSPHPLEATP